MSAAFALTTAQRAVHGRPAGHRRRRPLRLPPPLAPGPRRGHRRGPGLPPGSAWHGLLERGKDPVAVGVSGIAANAVRARQERPPVGNRGGGRGAMDVYHFKGRRRPAGSRSSASTRDAGRSRVRARTPGGSGWPADNRVGPADEAAFRVDFAAWLAGLPARKRRVAELLAEGHGTGEVAGLLGVTPGAVSQAADVAGGELAGVPGRGRRIVTASPSRRSERCCGVTGTGVCGRRSSSVGAGQEPNVASFNGCLILAVVIGASAGGARLPAGAARVTIGSASGDMRPRRSGG